MLGHTDSTESRVTLCRHHTGKHIRVIVTQVWLRAILPSILDFVLDSILDHAAKHPRRVLNSARRLAQRRAAGSCPRGAPGRGLAGYTLCCGHVTLCSPALGAMLRSPDRSIMAPGALGGGGGGGPVAARVALELLDAARRRRGPMATPDALPT